MVTKSRSEAVIAIRNEASPMMDGLIRLALNRSDECALRQIRQHSCHIAAI
jgi:hypothetical protein